MRKYSALSLLIGVALLSIQLPALSGAEVEVITVESFGYCCIHKTASFEEIESTISELWSHMQRQQIMPTGTMLGVYYNSAAEVEPEELDWEVGFPVTNVNPRAPLQAKIWNFNTVAKAVHSGSYETTGETYDKIFTWMEANGYEKAGPVLERYLTMPGPDTDPKTMKSEIWVPVKKK